MCYTLNLKKPDLLLCFPEGQQLVLFALSGQRGHRIWLLNDGLTHPVIWNPVIVIVRVAFITQAVFVMILLARVGEIGAVVLKETKGTLMEPICIQQQYEDRSSW